MDHPRQYQTGQPFRNMSELLAWLERGRMVESWGLLVASSEIQERMLKTVVEGIEKRKLSPAYMPEGWVPIPDPMLDGGRGVR